MTLSREEAKKSAPLADVRHQGLPTASAAAVDVDVLVAARAAEVCATVVTNNPGHMSRWVPVFGWP